MHDQQLILAPEAMERIRTRCRLGGLVCIAVLAVASLAMPASADECETGHDRIEILLPEGEDFVEEVKRFRLDLDTCLEHLQQAFQPDLQRSRMWTQYFPLIRFEGAGRGLFEAKIVVTEQQSQLWSLNDPDTFEPQATERTASPPFTNFPPGGLPNSFDATARRWLYARPFASDHATAVVVSGTWLDSERDVYSGEMLHFLATREFELRVSIRRIPNRCYMHASVSGGAGAGEYFGDVAYFGNPTGVSQGMIDQLAGMQEWARNMADSMGAEDEGGNVSDDEESSSSPFDDLMAEAGLDGVKSLTLQDVKLGSGGGTGSLGGFGEMISAFNLTAHDVALSEPYEGEIFDKNGNVVGNLGTVQDGTPTHLGLKAPGLAIANLRDCNVAPPEILFHRCPGEEEINMEQSPYCGFLLGKVCHEAGHKLTVRAEFIAGDDVTSCIQ